MGIDGLVLRGAVRSGGKADFRDRAKLNPIDSRFSPNPPLPATETRDFTKPAKMLCTYGSTEGFNWHERRVKISGK